jgi:hypothetical protein
MFYLRDLHGIQIFEEGAVIQLQLIGILSKLPLQHVLEGLIIGLKLHLRG